MNCITIKSFTFIAAGVLGFWGFGVLGELSLGNLLDCEFHWEELSLGKLLLGDLLLGEFSLGELSLGEFEMLFGELSLGELLLCELMLGNMSVRPIFSKVRLHNLIFGKGMRDKST